jgi:hypothetical protein
MEITEAYTRVIKARNEQIARMRASIINLEAMNIQDSGSLYARLLEGLIKRKKLTERPEYLTVSDIHVMTGCTHDTIRRWINKRGLEAAHTQKRLNNSTFKIRTDVWLVWATANQPLSTPTIKSRAVPRAGWGERTSP